MIQTINHVPHHFAQVFEIQQQASFVEFAAGQGHANLIVVAVRVLALSLIVPQVMPCGKRIFDGDFEHGPLRREYWASESSYYFTPVMARRFSPGRRERRQ